MQVTSVAQRESDAMSTNVISSFSALSAADSPGASWNGWSREAAEPSRPHAASATANSIEAKYRPIIPPSLLLRDPYVVDAGFDEARRAGVRRFDHQPDRLAGERADVGGCGCPH